MNHTSNYCRVDYMDGAEKVFCYRTGTSVYEETFSDGVLVASGYNFAGYPLNVLTNCPSRLKRDDYQESSAFDIEIDGMSIFYGLKFEDFTQTETETGIHAVLILSSTIKPVVLKVHTLLDGTRMFTRYIEVENCGSEPISISKLGIFGGGMETMDRSHFYGCEINEMYSLGYFDNGAWGNEGEFSWHPLTPDTTSINMRYQSGRYRHPLLFIRNNVAGEIWSVQIGWSAGCRFSVNFNSHPMQPVTHLSLSCEITGNNPLYVLEAGASFTTPEVYVGMVKGDLDEAVNDMHAHIRRSVLTMPEAEPGKAWIGCGMGPEHDMSVETSKAFIRQMKDMGGEIFIIDAGWACPPEKEMQWGPYNGINQADKDRYPNGMKELSDYCHEVGMKFAMWIEIERLGKYAEMYEKKPEWRPFNIFGEQSEGYLDFSNQEVAAWAEEELARMISEFKLDMLRIDHNAGSKHYYDMRDTGTGRKECVSLKHGQAVYKMYQNLKKRFPNVVFENCAGGGGRTDLGMMKAFSHTWVSDWQRMPRAAVITSGMTMALPPERVDRLFAGMGCHEFGSIDAHIRNTMLTHMSLNVVAPAMLEANEEVMEFIRHSTDIYKNFIRPFLCRSKIFHHTPETPLASKDNKVSILEIASPEAERGAITIIALTGNEGATMVKFRGASVGKRYRVTLDNTGASFEADGAKLRLKGLPIEIMAGLSSELVLYEECR